MTQKKVLMTLIMSLYAFILLCAADIVSALDEKPVLSRAKIGHMNIESFREPGRRPFFTMVAPIGYAVPPFAAASENPRCLPFSCAYSR